MNVGVVLENKAAARLVRRVLDDPRVEVFNAGDRSGAIMGIGSLAAKGMSGVLLLDSDTLEERALAELEAETSALVAYGNAARPRKLVLAIPQVEAILFEDRAGLERALGKPMTDEDTFEARFRPKAVFHRLLGCTGDSYAARAESCAITVIDRLDDASLRRMAEHPMMREIRDWVDGVQPRPLLRGLGDPPGRWRRARGQKLRHASPELAR